MEALSPASFQHLLRVALRGARRLLLLSSPILILAAGLLAVAENSIAAGLPVLVAGIPIVASAGSALQLRALRVAGGTQPSLATRAVIVAFSCAFLAAAAFFIVILVRTSTPAFGAWLLVSAGWGVLWGAIVLLPGEHS